jgi:predicted O-methyltransferase YrrM
MEPVTPLCALAVQYGTDKWGKHTYTTVYHNLFKDRREQVHKVLEIGVLGGASLRMWRDYFPHAMVYGIDNNRDALFTEDRITTVYADQHQLTDLEATIGTIGGDFDLIVDDGSHFSDEQILTANFFKQYLAPNGVLIIEDVKFPNRVTRRTGGTVIECALPPPQFRRHMDNRLVLVLP